MTRWYKSRTLKSFKVLRNYFISRFIDEDYSILTDIKPRQKIELYN